MPKKCFCIVVLNRSLKDFGKNFLKVVVSEEWGNKIIITVHWLAKKRVRV